MCAARPHDRLDLLAVPGPGDDPVGDVEQVATRRRWPAQPASLDAHAAVPPTVRRATRRVGTPSPTGTPWPSLPQVPGRAHGEVVAHGVDVLEHLGAVADEVALADRLGDLAVLDQVRLGHAEHEVAGGGVDLAAAEVGHEHAVGGAGDDVVGVVGRRSIRNVLVIRTIGRCW